MSTRGSQGTCFAFRVHSPVTFQYLRGGTGRALEVVERAGPVEEPVGDPIREWLPRPDHPFHARLFETERDFMMWIDGTGWYSIDTDAGRITIPSSGDIRREERLWGFPTALCFLAAGYMSLHAAAVDIGGRALLFAGPGRHGKTTLAAGFLQAGYRVLAEDLSCCRPDPKPAITPGPAMLRVRRDVFGSVELPGTYAVGEDPDRVHLAFDPGIRGDNHPLPIAGILLLRDWTDEFRLAPVDTVTSMPDLWALSFKLPTDEDRARCFGQVSSLAGAVTVMNFSRPRDLARLPDTVEFLVEAFGG